MARAHRQSGQVWRSAAAAPGRGGSAPGTAAPARPDDELAGWLGDHDRYGGHGGDRAFFLECWNGGAFIVDRVKHRGDPIRIARAALAIVGGMQPDRLRQALTGPDDGLGARFAYVFP